MMFKAHLILAAIDTLLSQQVTKILHHPRFQRLEASWRGIFYLLQRNLEKENVQLRLLDINWSELSLDLLTAIDFDQSQVFKKIYTEEFDQPGGTPYGLLIGDYFIDPRSQNGKKDVHVLAALSGVAAASFSPCIIGVSPQFLGIDHQKDLESLLDLESIFKQAEYQDWKRLRQSPDTRFIGLTFSRVCLRLPYKAFSSKGQDFYFEEKCTETEDYLWGNSAYCFASVVIRSFQETGWFLKIKGTHQDKIQGGIVEGLPIHYYAGDVCSFYTKPSLEISLKDWQSRFLISYGIIVLSFCRYSVYCAFYDCPTLYQPYLKLSNSQKMGAIGGVDTVLCVSRFAHYLKIIGRQKIGLLITVEMLQSYLQQWLFSYTASPSGELTDEFLRKYPLREVWVEVQEEQKKPGHYFCTVELMPHQYTKQLEVKLFLILRLP